EEESPGLVQQEKHMESLPSGDHHSVSSHQQQSRYRHWFGSSLLPTDLLRAICRAGVCSLRTPKRNQDLEAQAQAVFRDSLPEESVRQAALLITGVDSSKQDRPVQTSGSISDVREQRGKRRMGNSGRR